MNNNSQSGNMSSAGDNGGKKREKNKTLQEILDNLELDEGRFNQLEAGVYTYMMDPNHLERRNALGSNRTEDRIRAGDLIVGCENEFLERMGWGARMWGQNVVSKVEGRTLFWPADKEIIKQRMRPILRRPLRNDRQKAKQSEYRKQQQQKQPVKYLIHVNNSDGSLIIPTWTEKSDHLKQPLTYEELCERIHDQLRSGCNEIFPMKMLGSTGLIVVEDDNSFQGVIQSVAGHAWLDEQVKVMVENSAIEKLKAEERERLNNGGMEMIRDIEEDRYAEDHQARMREEQTRNSTYGSPDVRTYAELVGFADDGGFNPYFASREELQARIRQLRG